MKKYNKFAIFAILFLMVFSPVLSIKAEPGIDILDIKASDISGKTVEIEWTTSASSNGKIIFGESKDNLQSFIIDGSKASKYHSVKLGNLKEETTYYYKIIAYSGSLQVESFIKKFKTKEFHDKISPKISNAKIAYISGTAAVVAWNTDEDGTSRVEYGENENYKKRAGSRRKSTEHFVILRKLKPGTQYFLRLYSIDKDKNRSGYAYKEFTTRETDKIDKEKLSISRLRPSGPDDTYISSNSIKVGFKANHYAYGSVTLKKKGMRSKKIDLGYGLKHSAVFLNLEPSASYKAYISMKDIFGKRYKEDFVISTKNISIVSDEEKVEPADEEVIVLGEDFSFYTPASALYRVLESGRVYSIINNMHHYITGPVSFWEYGYEWRNVKTVSREKLQKYPRVKLIKSPDNSKIYYLYKRGDKILKINIPSPSVFTSYAGNKWGDIVKITQSDIDSYQDVKLIRTKDNPAVYYLENGKKRYVSYDVFVKRGFSFSDVMEVNQAHLDSYGAGEALK